MKPIIFLDMDGVLVDFVTGMADAIGKKIISIPRGNSDMETWPGIDMPVQAFQDALDAQGHLFWTELKKYSWSDELVDICETVGDTYILTAPSRNPGCSSGKVAWIENNYPSLSKKIVLARDKFLCATPSRILIDDTEQKIADFINHDGRTILFPQPWNANAFMAPTREERLAYIRHALNLYTLHFKENGII